MRKATEKDYRATNKSTTSFRDAIRKDITYATLKDHGGNAKIEMRWDLNEASKRDLVFLLEINGQKAHIDLEELMSYTRLV